MELEEPSGSQISDSSAPAELEAPAPGIAPVLGGQSPHAPSGIKKKAPWFVTAATFILLKLKAIWFFLVTILKFGSLGKILLTSGTMLVSIALYSIAFGWPFAAGFVLCIFVHEMGHVYVGWRQGLKISAPVFVPFMGAVIFSKRNSESAWGQAIMGIGGPIGGTIAGIACWGIFALSGNPFFLALAYVTFFMNLFNLLPVPPLDGGWITGAVSPYIWAAGLVGMVAGFVTGFIRNPLVVILVILSLPSLYVGLKTGRTGVAGATPALPRQRILMGVYYVGLAAFLFGCMRATNLENYVRKHQGATVALRLRR